jgi:hypothetical protein
MGARVERGPIEAECQMITLTGEREPTPSPLPIKWEDSEGLRGRALF